MDRIPRYAREHALIKDDRGIRLEVDLHWGLSGWPEPFPVDLKSWWARLEPVHVGDTIVNCFSPSDLVLYLCLHLSDTLAWIPDLAGLLSAPREIDFYRLFDEARKLRIRRILFWACSCPGCLLLRSRILYYRSRKKIPYPRLSLETSDSVCSAPPTENSWGSPALLTGLGGESAFRTG